MREIHHRLLDAIAEPTRLHILRSLIDQPEATISDLLADGASVQTLRRHLEALVSVGVVLARPGQSDGETPGRPPARFSLATEFRQGLLSIVLGSSQQRDPLERSSRTDSR